MPRQARHRLKEQGLGGGLVRGRLRQVGVAVPELGHDPRELRQPTVLQEVVGGPLALQPRPQGVDQRLVGLAAPGLGRPGAEHVRALRGGPAPELVGQARLADAGLPEDHDRAHHPEAGGPVLLDQRPELGLAPHEGHPEGAGGGPSLPGTVRLGPRPYARGQRLRLRFQPDVAELRAVLRVGGQSAARVPGRRARLHEPHAGGLLRRVPLHPPLGGPCRRRELPRLGLQLGQAAQDLAEPRAPEAALRLHPEVELGGVLQPEALQELPAVGRVGFPEGRDQVLLLFLAPARSPRRRGGLPQDVEVQRQMWPRLDAEQVALDPQEFVSRTGGYFS